jgi:hypothetical protein
VAFLSLHEERIRCRRCLPWTRFSPRLGRVVDAMPTINNPLLPRMHEAVRVIAGQLGCSNEEALEHLRTRSAALQYRVYDYARLVVEGMVRFDR